MPTATVEVGRRGDGFDGAVPLLPNAQGGADGALAEREERAGDQHQRVPPDAAGEQWRERREQV
jgi:hypothetical protein